MYAFQAHLKKDPFKRLAKKLRYKKAFLENALVVFFLDDKKRKIFFDMHPAEEKELLEIINNSNKSIKTQILNSEKLSEKNINNNDSNEKNSNNFNIKGEQYEL